MSLAEHTIYKRSYDLSLGVIQLCRSLPTDLINRSIISQLIRSVTSVSANLQEADSGISRKDFINKITIALKEARETTYWLRILIDSQYISQALGQPLLSEADEIAKILGQIKVNAQANLTI